MWGWGNVTLLGKKINKGADSLPAVLLHFLAVTAQLFPEDPKENPPKYCYPFFQELCAPVPASCYQGWHFRKGELGL